MSASSSRWRPSEDRLLAAGAAVAVFLFAWGLVHVGWWRAEITDIPTYELYGTAIVHHGQVPYRDFALAYPPGALPVFVLPELFGNYGAAFAWLMALCGLATIAVVERVRGRAIWFVAVSPVLVGSLILTRFDLWPALLAVAALAALLDGRHRLGWGLLGAAVAAKLWPLALAPLAYAWSRRAGRGEAALVGVAVAAVCFVPFGVLGPHGLWESVYGQFDRPLQIESLGAAFVTTFGHPQVVSSHGSQNLAGEGGVAAALSVATAFSLVALWIGFARGPITRERLIRYAAAVVCATIAFGKVLSPQYLIWLVPLVPLVRGRRGALATALLASALVLTQVWFPERYWEYVDGFHLAGVVLARDLALVALLAVLALPLRDVDA
jgi:uncharacterized membrane protein